MNDDNRQVVDSGVFSPCEGASYCNCKVCGKWEEEKEDEHVRWVLTKMTRP